MVISATAIRTISPSLTPPRLRRIPAAAAGPSGGAGRVPRSCTFLQPQRHVLAMLGHEIRNPLAAIRNALFILERAMRRRDRQPSQ